MSKRFKCPADWTASQRLEHYSTADPATGCLVFTGTLDEKGYGILLVRRQRWKAHRLAWVTAHGPIPTGMHVLHRCDNPSCIKAGHLVVGTNGDNVADMIAKGRQSKGKAHSALLAKGEKHWSARLTLEQAREVFSAPGRQADIAARFGVAITTVSMIKRRQTWKHIHA